jgi:hypothetical protein
MEQTVSYRFDDVVTMYTLRDGELVSAIAVSDDGEQIKPTDKLELCSWYVHDVRNAIRIPLTLSDMGNPAK